MKAASSGIWIIDGSAKTVFANERMAEILGVSVSELAGQPSFDYVFPKDVAAAQRLFEAKKRGDSNMFRFRLRRKDGTGVQVQVLGVPMHDGSGMIGIVGTFDVIPE